MWIRIAPSIRAVSSGNVSRMAPARMPNVSMISIVAPPAFLRVPPAASTGNVWGPPVSLVMKKAALMDVIRGPFPASMACGRLVMLRRCWMLRFVVMESTTIVSRVWMMAVPSVSPARNSPAQPLVIQESKSVNPMGNGVFAVLPPIAIVPLVISKVNPVEIVDIKI